MRSSSKTVLCFCPGTNDYYENHEIGFRVIEPSMDSLRPSRSSSLKPSLEVAHSSIASRCPVLLHPEDTRFEMTSTSISSFVTARNTSFMESHYSWRSK